MPSRGQIYPLETPFTLERMKNAIGGVFSRSRLAACVLVVTMHSRIEAQFGREVLAEAQFDELWSEILQECPGRDCPPRG